MTLANFYTILRNVVAAWPVTSDRVNTFAQFSRRGQLVEGSLGATYEDYQLGLFWSRPHAKGGYRKDGVEAKYGYLVTEHKRSRAVDVAQGKWEHIIFLNLAYNQEQFTGRCLTQNELESLIRSGFFRLFKELAAFQLHQVTKADNSTATVWHNQGQVDQLIADGDYLSASPGPAIGAVALPDLDQIEIALNNFDIPGTSSGYVELRVKTCELPQAEPFNYQTITPVVSGVVKC